MCRPSTSCSWRAILVLSLLLSSGSAMMAASEALRPYVLETCFVTNEALDALGGPYTLVWGERQLKFATREAQRIFQQDPERWLRRLAAAEAAAEERRRGR